MSFKLFFVHFSCAAKFYSDIHGGCYSQLLLKTLHIIFNFKLVKRVKCELIPKISLEMHGIFLIFLCIQIFPIVVSRFYF